jgi:Tfp pilus assembly protein PilO
MNLSFERRNLLVTLLLGGGAVAYVFFVFLPMQSKTAVLSDELATQRQFVDQSLTLVNSMAAVEDELAAARDFAAAWRTTAPPAGQLAPTFGAITRCAADAGVEVMHFDPQPVVSMETVTRAPLSLSCSGKFHEVLTFLELLEAQPQTIWVEDLLLSRGESENGRMTCELTLVVFADNREGSH